MQGILKQVGETRNVEITKRDGSKGLMKVREILVTNGIDTVNAEVTDDYTLEALSKMAVGNTIAVRLRLYVREWKSQNGAEMKSNMIRVLEVAQVYQ